MKKTFSILLTLALVLSFSLVTATPVAAATLEVGPGKTYTTIQAAVNAANPGDTINVAAGTYNEAVSIPSGKDGLEIAGTNAIVNGTSLGDVNGFNIASNNVKIHGFTIQNFVSTVNLKGWGIYTQPGTSGGELYNNTIKLGSGGIYIHASTDYEVYDNNINNLTGNWPLHGHGIIVYSSGPTEGAISGNIIGKLGHPNIISDTTGTAPGSGQGIFVGSDNVLALLVDADGTKVEYNIISNVSTTKAIQVAGVTTTSTVDVTHNQISGSKLCGLHIQYCGTINVNSNTFSGPSIWPVVLATYDAAHPGNCLTGEEMYDIFKNNGNTFDKAAAAVTPAGNAINTSSVNPNCRYIQSDIQDAIDDAHTGDSVEVLAGTYAENVVINKPNITLRAGSSPIIDAGGTGDGIRIAANNVIVDGFTVTNASGGAQVGIYVVPSDFRGITIKNCTVYHCNDGILLEDTGSGDTNVVDHNTVYDCIDPDGDEGVGILLWAGAGATGNSDCKITNNTVYNTDRQGICLGSFPDGMTNTNNEVSGNIVHDTGCNMSHMTYGVDGHGIVLYDADNNVVLNNEVYNCVDKGTTYYHSTMGCYYQFGIGVFWSKDNTISCNEIHGNEIGVMLYANDANTNTVNFNSIHDNIGYGLINRDAFTINAINNWWGSANGPEDPVDAAGETTEVPPCTGSPANEINILPAGLLGDKVWDDDTEVVDYCPWLGEAYAPTKCVATSTGTGTACYTPSAGAIEALTAVATPFPPPVALPHGMFSFKVTGLTPGQTVTITIELPGPVPVGTKWWKYHAGTWYSLPIGSDNGDNIITITLTDGVFPGDADKTKDGVIIDPGGPGHPPLSYPPVYGLEIFSTEGGSVTTPGEGVFPYSERRVVRLVATPDAGYRFVEWTGNVSTIDDVYAAETTITILDWYSITANFETGEIPLVQYELTVSSTMGGSVTTPGEGTFPYVEGGVVSLVAKPAAGYKFVNWTSTVTTIANVNAATTTVTMNGDYSIKANFEFEETTTTDSTEGPSGSMGCFIATAAYGTPTAEQIDVLREFRDVVLLESDAGSEFVALYYQLSPPVADFIAGNELLRTLVRELLVDPVVWVVEATGAIWRN